MSDCQQQRESQTALFLPGPRTCADSLSAEANPGLRLLRLLGIARGLLKQALAQRADDVGLTDTQIQLLWLIETGEAATNSQNDIAQRLGISPAQVSGLVEQLRKKNCVHGERSARDRRRQSWALTEAGRQLAEDIRRRLESHPLWSRVLAGRFEALTTELKEFVEAGQSGVSSTEPEAQHAARRREAAA